MREHPDTYQFQITNLDMPEYQRCSVEIASRLLISISVMIDSALIIHEIERSRKNGG
jgi:hypothetical protein